MLPLDSSTRLRNPKHRPYYVSLRSKQDREEGCCTPKRRIQTMMCPAAPKKKATVDRGRQRMSPKKGYFVPPDLDLIFRKGNILHTFSH
ncbi:hypothetical protein VNO78_31509 [Psophocarpus tetragonolobus]|uniref:Uncharacterized protein n=1 Tax=Psophocarpus tetragonolobus TaxID=3891 RepID=A0AAN9RYF3_PSOTE